uniref:Uncharacterized protein n=1 Tax=Hippocampus comes TaxID=109280 RepID=A0A3Q2Z6I3_HIPCM
ISSPSGLCFPTPGSSPSPLLHSPRSKLERAQDDRFREEIELKKRDDPTVTPEVTIIVASLRSPVEGILAGKRRPRQRVDVIIVAAQPTRHLALLAHVDQ